MHESCGLKSCRAPLGKQDQGSSVYVAYLHHSRDFLSPTLQITTLFPPLNFVELTFESCSLFGALTTGIEKTVLCNCNHGDEFVTEQREEAEYFRSHCGFARTRRTRGDFEAEAQEDCDGVWTARDQERGGEYSGAAAGSVSTISNKRNVLDMAWANV